MERLRSRSGFFEGTRAEEPPPRGRRRLQFYSTESARAPGLDLDSTSPRAAPPTGALTPPVSSPSPSTLIKDGSQATSRTSAQQPRFGRVVLPRILQHRYPEVFWDRRIAQIWAQLSVETPPERSPDVSFRELGDEAVWSVSSAKPGNGIEMMRDGNVQTFFQTDGAQPHKISIQFRRKTKVAQVRIFLNYQLDESYTPNRLGLWTGSDTHDLRETVVCHLHEPRGWIVIPLPPPAAVLEFNEAGLVLPPSPPVDSATTSPAGIVGRSNRHSGDGLPRAGGTRDVPSQMEITTGPDEEDLDHWVAPEASPPRSEQTRPEDERAHPRRTSPVQAWLETFHIQIVVYSNHQNGRDSHIRQVLVVGPRECGSDLRSTEDDLVFTSNEFASFAVLR